METKREIRTRIMKERTQMDPLAWQEKTACITEKVVTHDWFLEAKDVYVYVDCKGEVGTRLIIKEALRLGKAVWVPKVLNHTDTIEFIRIRSLQELSPGSFGILEPKEGGFADGWNGLVIMPGVAFDEARNRIGYGRGFYDRYLRCHPHLKTIALAFALQIAAAIPAEKQDIKPALLITEDAVFQDPST